MGQLWNHETAKNMENRREKEKKDRDKNKHKRARQCQVKGARDETSHCEVYDDGEKDQTRVWVEGEKASEESDLSVFASLLILEPKNPSHPLQ
ncbi:UNVERIFIED_CONTAM: hypothetical protein HHA_453570 [Hammondia hammondi]|eukprot:XP_008886860.1 hypothetical protein HHA_453570 [Hammondia hammondi]